MQSEYSVNYFAQTSSQLSAEETVNYINAQIVPVTSWATNWGISAGFAMLGVALFYQVVIILVKPDK